ncbi:MULTISPECIES: cytochrome C oxidase subunit IV family protein [unclassified Pseudonocardia]|uniref:cytochrome C oxidase subunit IV family protein n=1 Tax=unclassified Pseudonocardia TaxID=2619320 RepID=UPI00094B2047|nr:MULTISPECIES: cytochrome C oxidase subunit IV family protein [unclassified Pseudonocardia]
MTAPTMIRNRETVVWGALVLATLVSFGAGADHGVAGATGVVLALVIGFVKVRYVGLEFMELRSAPPALRLVFEAWCVGVCGMVVVLYLTGGG